MDYKDPRTPVAALVLLALLPATSAFASWTGWKSMLLIVFFAVGLTAFAVVLKGKALRQDLIFIALIWSISLCLLLASVLVSSNLRGHDIHNEYRISSEVLTAHKWNFEVSDLYNSVVSMTLLVPMLTIMSGSDALTVHILLLPLIYSIAPVVLYKVCRIGLCPRTSFLSTLLFMSFQTFYDEMTQLGRQEVGEVILLLLIWLLLSGEKSSRHNMARGVIAILLTVGLVTSHYSLAFIYLAFIVFSSVISLIVRRTVALANSQLVLMTIVATLSWYVFVAGGVAILQFNQVSAKVVEGVLVDFFTPTSRPTGVLLALGLVPGMSGILHELNRITQYVVQFCLILGIIVFARKRQMTRAEREMLPLMMMAFVFLVAAVALPFFASALQLTRIYHIALLFIAPCFVYGVEQIDSASRRIASFVKRFLCFRVRLPGSLPTGVKVKWVLAATILFSYFLFTSGWVWTISLDRPESVILDSGRMRGSGDPYLVAWYYDDLTALPDIMAAQWVRQGLATDRALCADVIAKFNVLTSYGGFPREGPNSVKTIRQACVLAKSYVYLSEYNSVGGFLYDERRSGFLDRFPISDIWSKLIVKNRVFSDGAAVYV